MLDADGSPGKRSPQRKPAAVDPEIALSPYDGRSRWLWCAVCTIRAFIPV